MLLARGAKIDALDKNGNSPLMRVLQYVTKEREVRIGIVDAMDCSDCIFAPSVLDRYLKREELVLFGKTEYLELSLSLSQCRIASTRMKT